MKKRTQVLFNFFLMFYLAIMLIGIVDGLFTHNKMSSLIPSALVLILFIMIGAEKLTLRMHIIDKVKNWIHH